MELPNIALQRTGTALHLSPEKSLARLHRRSKAAPAAERNVGWTHASWLAALSCGPATVELRYSSSDIRDRSSPRGSSHQLCWDLLSHCRTCWYPQVGVERCACIRPPKIAAFRFCINTLDGHQNDKARCRSCAHYGRRLRDHPRSQTNLVQLIEPRRCRRTLPRGPRQIRGACGSSVRSSFILGSCRSKPGRPRAAHQRCPHSPGVDQAIRRLLSKRRDRRQQPRHHRRPS